VVLSQVAQMQLAHAGLPEPLAAIPALKPCHRTVELGIKNGGWLKACGRLCLGDFLDHPNPFVEYGRRVGIAQYRPSGFSRPIPFGPSL
jgi:hypothetical protein